ncbi:MAG TPA: hypothetical protein VGL81_22500 [Polyangiaceae bacterium]|jgi:hypothetical protein
MVDWVFGNTSLVSGFVGHAVLVEEGDAEKDESDVVVREAVKGSGEAGFRSGDCVSWFAGSGVRLPRRVSCPNASGLGFHDPVTDRRKGDIR